MPHGTLLGIEEAATGSTGFLGDEGDPVLPGPDVPEVRRAGISKWIPIVGGVALLVAAGWLLFGGKKKKEQVMPRCNRVVFRRWKEAPHQNGEVIALFPGLPTHRGLVTSYMHIGQHGDADYYHVMSKTTRVRRTDPDVQALAAELREIGYRLCPPRKGRK